MLNTSELISKYQIEKSEFYKRRSFLIELGYNLQGKKKGRTVVYRAAQVELLDQLNSYLEQAGTMAGFKSFQSSVNSNYSSDSHSTVESQPTINESHSDVSENSDSVEAQSLSVETDEKLSPEKEEQLVLDSQDDFKCILTGYLKLIDDSYYLDCPDGNRFRLKKFPPSLPQEVASWSVLPSTNSNGQITNIILEKLITDNCSLLTEKDDCLLINEGRIVQLGKQKKTVLVKLKRPGQKTLKITLLGASKEMEVGQLWKIIGRRQKDCLYIKEALRQDAAQEQPALSIDAVSRVNNGANVQLTLLPEVLLEQSELEKKESQTAVSLAIAPTKIAKKCLEKETASNCWQLSSPKRRSSYWEWDCQNLETNLGARVIVFDDGQACVFLLGTSRSDQKTASSNRLVVKPLGAARGMGGNCFQVQLGCYEIVLDCGLYLSPEPRFPALEQLDSPDLVLISHAHLDHLGALPELHHRYPGVRMISTSATREVAHKTLLRAKNLVDSISSEQIEKTLWRLETKVIGLDFEALPGLKVRFINAGHILGAAAIYLQYQERSLLYTGDFNVVNTRTTTGIKLAELPLAEMLISSSTFGATLHRSRKTLESDLVELLLKELVKGQNVLVASGAIATAPEILLLLSSAPAFIRLNLPIYVDEKVEKSLELLRENLELLPTSTQNFLWRCEAQLFGDESRTGKIIPLEQFSDSQLSKGPNLLITSFELKDEKLLTYPLSKLLESSQTTCFFSEYTEEGHSSAWRTIIEGSRLVLGSEEIEVSALCYKFNLFTHADQAGVGQVINQVKPQHLVLVNGSEDALHSLARAGRNQSKYYIHIPHVGDAIEYGIPPEHLKESESETSRTIHQSPSRATQKSDQFATPHSVDPTLQKAKTSNSPELDKQIDGLEPATKFEINLEKIGEQVFLLTIPSLLAEDERWQSLTKKRNVQAIYENFSLKFCGDEQPLTPRNEPAREVKKELDCCASCQFLNNDCCGHSDSPLFELKVDPIGICSQFARS